MNNQVSFDSMLRMAIRETYMEQINSIPSEDKLEEILNPSPSFKKKINAIVLKETRNEKLMYMRRAAFRVAVVLMMCVSLTFGSLLTAKAVRESVATTILEWHDKFTKIFIETDAPPTELPEIRFNYIPEGFELVEKESYIRMDYQLFTYKHNGSFINIYITNERPSNSDFIDNETSTIYTIKIEEHYCLWRSSIYENQLIGSRHDKFYSIVSSLTIEEIINIYKNIEVL